MKERIIRGAQIIIAIILLQSLYFKFTAQPISIQLFSILGVEPWGRWAVGLIELLTGILLILPQTNVIGTLLALGIGTGAVIAHLFFIGIFFGGDSSLFFLASIILMGSSIIAYIKRGEIKKIYAKRI